MLLMDRSALALVLLLTVSCGEQVASPRIGTTDVVEIVAEEPPRPTRQQLLDPLLEQIHQQEKEMLPFDEPKHEFGKQLDGRLRPAWEAAYKRGQPTYNYTGDRYQTMYKGLPFTPQVCADFIVDTIDRVAGTWYMPSLKEPGKTLGRYDVRMHASSQGFDVRRNHELMQFFKANPDKFTIVFEGSGPRPINAKQTREWMKDIGVEVGDIVAIQGKAPWDRGKEIHTHSFFVTTLNDRGEVKNIVGNWVYPVTGTLATEGGRTPLRKVISVVRMTDEFLGQVTGLMSPM